MFNTNTHKNLKIYPRSIKVRKASFVGQDTWDEFVKFQNHNFFFFFFLRFFFKNLQSIQLGTISKFTELKSDDE